MDEATWAAAGLYDPAAPDADDRRGLLEYLTSVGCTLDEMVANADGLTRLASRRVLFGTEPRLTVAELAERSGCDIALVRRVRLAAGLPDPGDEPACSTLEIELMQSFALGSSVLGEDVTLQFTRVLGNAATGIAEAALATFAVNRSLPLLARGGTSADIAKAGADATVALLGVAPVLDALLREHFDAASNGRFAGEERTPTVRVAVAFVDLVESTHLTLTLDGATLADALGDFERVASEAVVRSGGRVVKRIGDAVMFVASDVAAACEAALAIVAAMDAHPTLVAARGAIAFGDVLPRDGDYFGTAVNIAARAVPLATPGTVVVDDSVRVAVTESDTRLPMSPLGDHALRGFDIPVTLFRLGHNR
jgi:adenylate cyclase